MGDGHACIGRHGVRRGHSGHHLELDAGGAQLERLLPAAAEDERVAALQPNHALTAAAELHQEGVGLLLRERLEAGPLAGEVQLGARRGHRHHPWIHQGVVDERIAAPQELGAAQREEAGIARARADQIDRHGALHVWICSSPASSNHE